MDKFKGQYRFVPVLAAVLVTAFLAVEHYLFRLVFRHPLKERPGVYDIPESDLYKSYRDKMTECVKDMEETPFESVSILSADGCRLYGRLYSIKKDAPLVLFFHGYHGVFAWDGYGFFKICKKYGMNILLVDERAHGKSEGKAITFGIKERYDCKLWTEYAAERFGKDTDIFLAGVSMGAATVMMASNLGLPENVKGIVADCGYSEPAAILKETVRKLNFPVKPVYWLINLSAKIFGHFNLEETTALEAVKRLQIPILFIHGGQDSVVPLSMCDMLYESCPGEKKKVVIEGADHANSALTDFSAYEKAVREFLAAVTDLKKRS